MMTFHVRVWVISAKARATVSFASSEVMLIAFPVAAVSRLTSWRPSAGFSKVPSDPVVVLPITPIVGAGVGLAAALFDIAKPMVADVGSFVIAPLRTAAITAGFCVFRLTIPARIVAVL